MEVGSVATPFEHRSYGEELALCQRYYQHYAQADGSSIPGNGVWRNSTRADTTMILPVLMRATPTIAAVSITNVDVYAGGSGADASAVANNGSSPNCVGLNWTSSGGADGEGVYLYASGAVAGFTADSEL